MNAFKAAAVAAAATFVMLQAVAPDLGMAGGVIKYKVSVKNELDHACEVDLNYGAWELGTDGRHSFTISPGAEHTFVVEGPQCPKYLDGDCGYTGPFRRCTGGDKEGTWDCPPACFNSEWTLHVRQEDNCLHFDKR